MHSGFAVDIPIPLSCPKLGGGTSNVCPQRTADSLPEGLPYYHTPRVLLSLPLVCKFYKGRDQDNLVPGSSKEFSKQGRKEGRQQGGKGLLYHSSSQT